MHNRTALCLTAFFSLGLGGCGTIQNLAPEAHSLAGALKPSTPYGGVQADLEFASLSVLGGGPFGVGLAAAALVDVPLSAVGDTLTLPCVLYCNVRRHDEIMRWLEQGPGPIPEGPPTSAPPPGQGSSAAPGPYLAEGAR
jgi:uncharacterized protein YceK